MGLCLKVSLQARSPKVNQSRRRNWHGLSHPAVAPPYYVNSPFKGAPYILVSNKKMDTLSSSSVNSVLASRNIRVRFKRWRGAQLLAAPAVGLLVISSRGRRGCGSPRPWKETTLPCAGDSKLILSVCMQFTPGESRAKASVPILK